jgi:PRTRC genetic system protein A
MMDMNTLALLNMGLIHAPVVGGLPAIEDGGQRVVVARNGVFIQYESDWLKAVKRVGDMGASLPYGEISENIELRFKRFPKPLIAAFHEQAKKAFPNEAFAYIHWHQETNSIKLVPAVVLEATEERIAYGHVEVMEGWQCIGDIHSHPRAKAYYSEDDNEDDKEGVKCSFVIGLSNDMTINSVVGRFCLFGTYTKMTEAHY